MICQLPLCTQSQRHPSLTSPSSRIAAFQSLPSSIFSPSVPGPPPVPVDLSRAVRDVLMGHLLLSVSAENANKLEESAREHHVPCPEHYNGFCMHGKCEHAMNTQEPSCRYRSPAHLAHVCGARRWTPSAGPVPGCQAAPGGGQQPSWPLPLPLHTGPTRSRSYACAWHTQVLCHYIRALLEKVTLHAGHHKLLRDLGSSVLFSLCPWT